MTHRKSLTVAAGALALAATLGLGALTANAEPTPLAAPAAAEAVPAEGAPSTETAAPAAETAAPAVPSATSLTSSDLRIGAAVFDSDGAKIGEVNRVTSEPSGAVTEIHVTTGGKAGLNAAAVIVPADKIAGAGDSVKLSLSAQEVKSLPAADNGAG
ncbi:MAG: PRC-barrel domain-containing protein [Hyphomicrobium sp.]